MPQQRPGMERPDATAEAQVEQDEGELLLIGRESTRLHETNDVERIQAGLHEKIKDRQWHSPPTGTDVSFMAPSFVSCPRWR